MNATRRELIGGTIAFVATACGTNRNPTAPLSTTPLLTLLKRDGYTVVEQTNPYGGVILVINGKLQQIKVGTELVGIDSSMGMDPSKSGPPNLNMGQYQVPDNLGYVLVS